MKLHNSIGWRALQASKNLLAVALCAGVSSLGCGSKGPVAPASAGVAASRAAEPAEIPLQQQTEQKLDPLTKDDVKLYLKVMSAAAARVKSPLPADTAALNGASRILAGRASGRVPSPDEVKTLQRANLVTLSMDQIIADEMKLDGRAYRGIAEAVEAVVPNPAQTATPIANDSPTPDHVLSPLEKRLADVNATNQKFLAPYRQEMQSLIEVVRNPANLPK